MMVSNNTDLGERMRTASAGQRVTCSMLGGAVAGVVVEGADNLEQAVATVTPGTTYLPADASTGTFGDIYATIPGGRDWRSRQHGGSTVYRVRASI